MPDSFPGVASVIVEVRLVTAGNLFLVDRLRASVPSTDASNRRGDTPDSRRQSSYLSVQEIAINTLEPVDVMGFEA